MIEYRVYRVEVETTNALKDTFAIRHPEGKNEYYDCEEGVIYVFTNNPSEIFEKLGADNVKSIEYVGVGYLLEEKGGK